MDTFERHVLETLDKYNMIKKGQVVIAAVSGGFDSMCMLHVLCNLRPLRDFEVCVAHVNHMLREEADDDLDFVVETAKKLGIKVYTKKCNVSEYAEGNKISFETAGRILRYSFFNEIAKDYPQAVIATAHNANDSVESMLMHLLRGSGLAGLIGIRPVSKGIIRPLIECDRQSIEEYCKHNGINIRHDYTNDSDDYKRNDIRHNVLSPILERCSIDSLLRTMNVLSSEEEFLETLALCKAEKCIKEKDGKKAICLESFNKLPLALKRRILRIAISDTQGENQVCLVHIDEIIKIAEKNYGGKTIQIPGGRSATIKKGEILI